MLICQANRGSGAAPRAHRPRTGSIATALAVSIVSLSLWAPGLRAAGATGTKAATAATGWDEAAGLQVMKGDSLDPGARIFDSPDYQQQMVVPGTGGQAYVLALKTQAVRALPVKSLSWTSDDKPAPDLSAAADAGQFLSDAGTISFTIDGTDWKIQPEPPLIGAVTPQELRADKPDYVHAAARYNPDPAAVKALKGVTTDTRIVVFFGTWCTYCKHWLPHFLKTLEVVGNPHITAEFFGVSEDQLEPKDALRQYGASSTPTFVVLQGGKEIGRIVENPEVSVEADLAHILGAQ
jgi:thiol-disulfide isomerase/thioredoxin